jgi:nitrite reductase/ring-hydroxylating ferredoxin subunit
MMVDSAWFSLRMAGHASQPRLEAKNRGTMVDAMALVRIAAVGELAPGTLMERQAAGRVIALCNHAGRIHAFDGVCPHHGGPLGQGNLVDGRIVCPWHAWEFSVADGALDFNPEIRLRRYRVQVEGDNVLLEIP